uniref:CRISPR-associated endonuclease Cas3'' n=1 Tax=Candidatus Fimivicinus sp. TaxID=3056640 RepID=UPI003FED5263
MYIAHKSIDSQRQQSVLEHLEGTAKYAQDFASVFGCGDYGRCLGMLHDIGKYSAGFQKRILEGGCKVDHSTAGAQLVRQLSRSPSTLAASYCIAGHHRGLLDGGSSADDPAESTLSARLKLTPEDYQAFRTEIDPTGLFPSVRPPLHMLGTSGFTIAFWIRMLYSCLVDADFLDTEAFMSNGSVVREPGEGIPALYEKLEEKLKEFKHPTNELNRMRCKILERCLQMAESERGLFTLTVPTGGGKTLSSLAFALKHAVRHKLRRV